MEKETGRLTPESFWDGENREVNEERREPVTDREEELFPAEPDQTEGENEQEEPMRDPFDSNPAEEPEEPMTEEEPEDEEAEDEIKKLIRILAIIGSAVLLVVLIGVIIAFLLLKPGKPAAQESGTQEESMSYQGAELLGVVFGCRDGIAEVYSAADGQTMNFDLNQAKKMTDQYGQPLSVDAVQRGQLVQVQYNSASGQVEMFRLTSRAQDLTDVTGLSLKDGQVAIRDETYVYDDQLICLYRGGDYPVEKVTKEMVVKASVMDGRLYTLQVLFGSGEVQIENIPQEYLGMELVLTPEKGDPVTCTLEKEGQKVTVTEGLVSYRVQSGNLVQDQGQIMVAAGEPAQVLTLKNSGKQEGRILFNINVEGATITIGEDSWKADEELTLPYGEYEALIEAEGFDPVEITLLVKQPYRVYHIDMDITTTKVVVSSSLSGSRLFLNGEYVKTLRGKAETFELEAGTYEFRVENQGYEPMTMKVTVMGNMADQILYFTGFVPVQEPPEESVEESAEQ